MNDHRRKRGSRPRVAPPDGGELSPGSPPGSAPGAARPPGNQRHWMVLCTKSRQEKAVARYLEARELEYYLPLIDRVSYHRSRKFIAQVPLFPGYIFLNGTAVDRYGAIDTRRVFQALPVRDQSRFQSEIGQIRHALANRAELELYPFAVVGRRCRVTRGPLLGLEGVITERCRNIHRLVLHVDVLGRGAALEIDVDLLEPIGEDESTPHCPADTSLAGR